MGDGCFTLRGEGVYREPGTGGVRCPIWACAVRRDRYLTGRVVTGGESEVAAVGFLVVGRIGIDCGTGLGSDGRAFRRADRNR